MTDELAHSQVAANVDKVREIIDEQTHDIAVNLADYACWNATVENVNHPDSAWCAINFSDFLGRVLEVDIVVMLDTAGRVTYRQGDLPSFTLNRIAPDAALLGVSPIRPNFEGLWKYNGCYYLIAGSGIYHDGDRGFGDESHGTLIMGYRLDTECLTRLSGLTHEQLTLCELSGDMRPVATSRISDQKVRSLSGVCAMYDLQGAPAAFMRVTSSFAQLDKLHASIYLILGIVAVFTLLGSLTIIHIVRTRVQCPLEDMQQALRRFHIGESVDWSHLVRSGDEFEELSRAFGHVTSALRDSQHSLLAIVEGAADAVIVADSSGRIQLANLKARELFGFKAHEDRRIHLLGLVPPSHRGELKRHIRTLRDSRAICEELNLRSATGETIQADVSSIVLDDGRFYASVRDVTERKRAEAALRAREEDIRKMAAVLPSVLWMMTADQQTVLYVSPAYEAIFGYTPGDLMENPSLWMQCIHPEDRPHVQDRMEYERGTRFEMEHRIIRKDGQTLWVQDRITPVFGEDGELLRVIGLTEDITDRKHADIELHASEERYRTLVESQTEGVISADLAERFDFANSAAERIFGVKPGALIGMSFHDFTSVEQFDEIIRQTESRRGGIRNSYEIVIRRPDGTERNIIITGNPRIDSQGELTGTFGVFEDITERKQAEAELTASASLLMATLESTGDGILVVDALGRATHSNKRYADMWGIPASFLEPENDQKLQSFIHEQLEYPDQYEARIRELYNSDEHEMDCIEFKDGRAFERFSCPLMQEGKIVGRVWSFRDVSENRRAEIALRESEERFRNLADTAPVLIWMAGVDRHCYYFNKTWISFTGQSMQHEYGKGWMQGVHPDDMKDCIDTYNLAFKAQRAFTMEFRLGHSDGTYHWVLDTGTPRRTADGRFTGYIGTCTDITDRKAAEEAMREGERRLHAIFQTAPDGIFLKNLNREYTHVNPSIERLLGAAADEIIGRTDDAFFDANAADHIRKTDERALQGEMIEEQNVHTIHGKPVTVSVVKVPVRDGEGRITGICAIARDVTKQQQVSEKRKVQEQYFSVLFEQLGSGILIVDPETMCIADANLEALRMLGVEKAAVVGIRLDHYSGDVKDMSRPSLGSGLSLHPTEGELIDADGHRIPVIKSVVAATLSDRKMLLVSFTHSERPEKADPRESAQQLEALAQQIREGLHQPEHAAAVPHPSTDRRGYSKL
jgi:PAS domain S-box-containing protein